MKYFLSLFVIMALSTPALAETTAAVPAAGASEVSAEKADLLKRSKELGAKNEELDNFIPLKLMELDELLEKDMITLAEMKLHLDALDKIMVDGKVTAEEEKTWSDMKITPVAK